MAKLDILYFAWVRERIGLDAETLEHPGRDMRVSDVIAMLAGRGGGYAEAFAEPARLRAALDQAFVPLDAPLEGARELALFPPVTGG
ncbi:molybdopterin converting factor subunit 1 [Rhizorhapis sp.]|uniref:molybdopterin converting factor subunit 1 n=1 Tax=Rhizorhapis sp. TaxID=1968842 RepID=UPI002B46059D|nr:molybdopterin converting factor subunit 1 [Rhizorhapis sp.]HKR17495.1 molybdopterin converting factor subunit 1 [Rhizorhapis sp.]HKX36392.1 molybdopterin converting factor subunit 1 [Rhizorhapis sp.]